MLYHRLRSFLSLTAVLAALVVVSSQSAFAQAGDEKVGVLGDKVSGLDERTTTLETSVSTLQRLKVSGYIQPQWQWSDIDSLGNQDQTRNFFTIRRGRIKFQHSTGNVSYLLYPDITENGVVLKEIIAGWRVVPEFEISMGSMNRPFGYEIAYSSSSREVTERSLAENRLFNGERDLGLQLSYSPLLGSIRPLLEVGLFNGSDNFGKGPIVFVPGATNAAFTTASVGSQKAVTLGGTSADTSRINAINTSLLTEAALFNGGYRQNAKEFIGHLRVPFLLSDAFSFDIGGSLSLGGINEPSDLRGEFTGTNGALVLAQTGKGPNSTFNAKSGSISGSFLESNRSIFGADAQFYLSVLPFGGTILKGEMYSGHVPFYGTSALFTNADATSLGAPRPSTVTKEVFGYYAMLVQNLTDYLQIAVRYDVFDPNTNVKGSDFNINNTAKGTTGTIPSALRGVNPVPGFGGDLKQSTIALDVNMVVSGALRIMLDFDIVTNETYTKSVTLADKSFATVTNADPNDNRFTFRMQYKF
jgi:hypothetical protein